MHNVIPGLLSRIFRKPQLSSLDTFLQNYANLNERDIKKDMEEMREKIIANIDVQFTSYIKNCEDDHFLSEIAYVVTMYMPPITTYQKIRARTILAQLLLQCDNDKKKEIIAYFIKTMQLDE